MGSLLSTLGLGSDSSSSGSSYNSILQCCDGVVDPLTLLAVLGSIIGLTVWLRQAIIDNVKKGRMKREIHPFPQIHYKYIKMGRKKREIHNLLQANPNEQNQINDIYELISTSIGFLLEEDNYNEIIKAGRQYKKVALQVEKL